MIAGFTGHRPSKIGGYKIPNPIYSYVCKELEKTLVELKPKKAITGMALGVDQWAAEICVKLDIPFIAAVPFRGQELYWPKESQIKYCDLLGQAEKIEYVNPGGYAAWKMQVRNEWIVNNCDILIGVYNGDLFGGTFNCIKYAKEQKKNVMIINPLNALVR